MLKHETCPDCGTVETDEVAHGYVEGFLAEADYYCRGCNRHRAEFSYGSWRDGSGLPASAETVRKLTALREHALFEGTRLSTAQLITELRRESGAPMMACRKALTAHNGDYAAALEDVKTGRWSASMLITHRPPLNTSLR